MNLMNKHHPDRHAIESIEERDIAAKQASNVTRAYGIVSDPQSRALHVLELMGTPIEENASGDLVGNEFLMQIMDLREEVDNTFSENDLKALLNQNRKRIETTCAGLDDAFRLNDLEQAKKLTAILQYWNRIEEKIMEKI